MIKNPIVIFLIILSSNCVLKFSMALDVNLTSNPNTKVNIEGGDSEPSSPMQNKVMTKLMGNFESSSSKKSYEQFNLTEIANYCNESFRTTIDFLKEFNTTGSFPDETDKTPMCYIRCYLENVGILTTEGELDEQRAIDMLWTTAENTINDCKNEMNGSPCERAYFLAKCVMTRALVDGRMNENN